LILANFALMFDSKLVQSFDGIDQNLLILLHGLGDNAHNFIKFGLKMRIPQTALLAIQGPFKIPFFQDGRAWFPSFDDQGYNLNDDDPKLVNGLIQTRNHLLSYIKSLGEWPLDKIFLLGFGHGGSVCLDVVHNGHLEVGGVISLGGFPIMKQPNLKCKIPIFISYGSNQDNAQQADNIDQSFTILYKVEGRDLEMPQDATHIKKVFEFLGKLLSLRNLALEKQSDIIEIT
jgi:predicted esterase